MKPGPTWERVQEIFHQALEQPPEARDAWLKTACVVEPELHDEVASLLKSDVDAGAEVIDANILRAFLNLHEDGYQKPSMEGRLVGHWRLLRKLGEGGMGAVYLAARADQHYESQAAVKLVRRGLDTDFILRRFRRERQILARLDHPNITRLFDGGATEDGTPYLVMEYIDGTLITSYATEHKLGVDERLRLCLPVCAAIAYAHRNFVVHRDLKPGNILIDANGAPKLLDFGISKLLHTDQPDAANTQEAAMMTPDYASPEQIQGNPITIASDVYSLGAVIYELLTGILPHRIEHCTPSAIERAICIDPVVPPSVAAAENRGLSRHLKGDVDNIIMHAMQKEPARRYASAEHLADDLQRFLEHRPVNARPDSLGYRASKFVQRHRVSVMLGGVAVTAVLIAILVAGRQARIAHQRFQDVRKLATTFVFDVEDAIRPLPGSTRARQLIARTGVDYLSSLSASSARDWDLKRELASAWLRIGVVQGGSEYSNLGESNSALTSFANAGRLLDEVRGHDPADVKVAFERLLLCYQSSELHRHLGRYQEAAADAQAGLQIASWLRVADPANDGVVQYTGLLHLTKSFLRLRENDLAGAESAAAAAAPLLQQQASAHPQNLEMQFGLSDLDARMGAIQETKGNLVKALVNFRKGVSLLETVCRLYPSNTLARRDLMFAYAHVGDVLGSSDGEFDNRGNLPASFEAYSKMAEQAKFLHDADPAAASALGDYGIALFRLGRSAPPAGPLRKATLERSRKLLTQAEEIDPRNRMVTNHLIWVANELGDYPAAIVKSEKTLNGKVDDFSILKLAGTAIASQAEAQANRGQRSEALATLDHYFRLAEKVEAIKPQTAVGFAFVARSRQTAGSVHAILAEREQGAMRSEDHKAARISYGKALDEWRKLEHMQPLLPPYVLEKKAAEQALAPGGLDRQVGGR